jgi:hypothetical protein
MKALIALAILCIVTDGILAPINRESDKKPMWRIESRISQSDYAEQKSARQFERLRKRLEHFSEWEPTADQLREVK